LYNAGEGLIRASVDARLRGTHFTSNWYLMFGLNTTRPSKTPRMPFINLSTLTPLDKYPSAPASNARGA
jgi:hypothetical protein